MRRQSQSFANTTPPGERRNGPTIVVQSTIVPPDGANSAGPETRSGPGICESRVRENDERRPHELERPQFSRAVSSD